MKSSLLPGEFTPLLQERLCDVGTHVPSFARGARLCRRFTGTPVSEATLRRYTERAGLVLSEHEATDAAAPAPLAPPPERPLWVLVDGVFVRLLHSEWREVKSLAIGEVQPPQVVQSEEVVECGKLSYFSRLLEVDAFIPAATGEIRRRGVDRAAVGAAADGAPWCQRFFDHHCPDAVRALDFYHGAEYVRSFSRELFPDGEATARWWAGQILHKLKHEGPEVLLRSLRTWVTVRAGERLGAQAAKTLDYFESREALLQYPALRAAGWPIGSGAVESGNKQVVEERMKGPGMFWADLTRHLRQGCYPIALLHAKT